MPDQQPPELIVVKGRKLGLNPPTQVNRMRCLHWHDYFNAAQLPPPKPFTSGIGGDPRLFRNRYPDTRMFDNDTLGCCVVAARGHAMLCWGGISGNPVQVTDAEVKSSYFRQTGGADDGLDIMTSLNDWMTVPFAGNLLTGYVALNPNNLADLNQALQYFGNVTYGIGLPVAWQNLNDWPAPPNGVARGSWNPGSWGGHCVSQVDGGPENVWVKSWGMNIPFANAAVPIYASEAYVLLDPLWFSRLTSLSIQGMNLAALKSDLAAFKASIPG